MKRRDFLSKVAQGAAVAVLPVTAVAKSVWDGKFKRVDDVRLIKSPLPSSKSDILDRMSDAITSARLKTGLEPLKMYLGANAFGQFHDTLRAQDRFLMRDYENHPHYVFQGIPCFHVPSIGPDMILVVRKG